MRGRKPAPTALKLITGERPDRINQDEPQPGDGTPTCPSDDPKIRAIWDYTMNQLKHMRVITLADRDVLHGYCQAVKLFEEATAMVEKDGLLSVGESGRRIAHPALRLQREASNQMRQFANEFGLTPSARTRIRVKDQAPAKTAGSDASRLLSG